MSRKRGKKSKAKVEAAPEEVLAEGSGPNESVEATAEMLAEAAADALPPPADVEVKKTRLTTDAWGQPIEVEIEDEPEPEAFVEAAEAETAAEEQVFEEAILQAEAEAELAVVPGDEALVVEAEAEGEELSAALPTTAASMDDAQLKNLVEALVFAADKPVTLQRLRQLTRVSDVTRLEQALDKLAEEYVPRGLALQSVSGGYQFRTNTSYSVWVQQLIAGRPVRLSRAQLETLAIVAYRQPITRPEVDDIRGVDSSATLRLLLDRSLIRVLGKKEDVGRPTLYGTTKEFLDFFSLSDLRELPTLREYSELTAESRKVISDRLGIEADATPGTGEEYDLEAPIDQAAEDAAAAAAVAAVTEVYGIEGQESPSVDVEAASSDDLADENVETSSSDIEASSESVEASSGDVELSSESDENIEMSSSDIEASSESVEASSDDVELSSGDVGAADESVEMSSSDAVVSNDDIEASTASVEASADDVEASSANIEPTSEDVEASGEDVEASSEKLEASADDVESLQAGAADDELGDSEPVTGMPRGAAQRDIIGRSTDGDEDPELRAAAEAELDAATAEAETGADALGSESLADDESSTGDVEMAGADAEDGADPAADGADSSVLDASASDSLDETDEPPAE